MLYTEPRNRHLTTRLSNELAMSEDGKAKIFGNPSTNALFSGAAMVAS